MHRHTILTTLSGVLLALATACTPAQLDTYQTVSGHTLNDAERAALLDLPDVTMRHGTTLIDTEGATAQARARHCDQWRSTALAAGWPAELFDQWASRIIFRESGCNPNAVSRTNDHGLMQLNAIIIVDMAARPHLWQPTIDALGFTPTRAQLLDPNINLICALGLYRLRGVAPWS